MEDTSLRGDRRSQGTIRMKRVTSHAHDNNTTRLMPPVEGKTAAQKARDSQQKLRRSGRAAGVDAPTMKLRQTDEVAHAARLKAEMERSVHPRKENVSGGTSGGNAQPPRRRRRGCGCLLWLFMLLLFCAAAFGALWIIRAHNTVTPIDQVPEAEQAAVAQSRAGQNVYVLFAGTDSRGEDAARSDTIIYTVFRPVDRKIEMVSIPRDTLAQIPDQGQDKINAALAYGGMELMDRTVENFLNSPVDYTVLLDFQSFAKIIDAMGGITIDVPEKMYLPEEGIDLEAGKQKLNGHDALAFVRWRGDGNGDLGRIERQKQFLDALMQKARHLMPWQAARTFYVLTQEVDTNMPKSDMVRLAGKYIGMSKDVLEFQKFEYDPQYINGVSYVLIDDDNINEVVQKMKYGIVLNSGDTYSFSTNGTTW
jgi:LCP family protein required for cell wall assembly